MFLPIIGAFIGYSTNYIAIKMLFWPYKGYDVLGFRVQGLIPKRRHELAVSIAETVDKELLSLKDFGRAMKDVDLRISIHNIVASVVEKKINLNLLEKFPFFGALSNGIKTLLVESICNTILDNFDGIVEKIMGEVEKDTDFKNMIVERIDSFNIKKLEQIILKVASKELRYITFFGGVLGFIIGVVQMLFLLV